MSFEVQADAYGRFMGRYSVPLATRFADLVGVSPGQRALDVGCGTGALTAELVQRLGAASVSAVDPSESFVATARERFPDADVRSGAAERLPFADATFDRTLAQLVVHFMADPVAGLREMARVTRPDGLVAACVWDHAGGGGPLAVFWRAALELDPAARDESGLAGAREGHLAELFRAAGLRDLEPAELTVRTTFAGFDAWWEPFTLGVGPAGDYVRTLDGPRREALRERCATLLPATGPIEVTATAWTVLGRTVSPV
ncbi:class I SAM-dependent methyltransferase [Dactylosporangium sp. CA-139114]|uniref:class I SAM-dependent methyltransferase n=1 Tax=Dactylosporangium sp. CA-139114 TaxID=3239931 RepID=UPI003D99644C